MGVLGMARRGGLIGLAMTIGQQAISWSLFAEPLEDGPQVVQRVPVVVPDGRLAPPPPPPTRPRFSDCVRPTNRNWPRLRSCRRPVDRRKTIMSKSLREFPRRLLSLLGAAALTAMFIAVSAARLKFWLRPGSRAGRGGRWAMSRIYQQGQVQPDALKQPKTSPLT